MIFAIIKIIFAIVLLMIDLIGGGNYAFSHGIDIAWIFTFMIFALPAFILIKTSISPIKNYVDKKRKIANTDSNEIDYQLISPNVEYNINNDESINIQNDHNENEPVIIENTHEIPKYKVYSANRYINMFYNAIIKVGYIDKNYFMELLSLNEYQYDYTLNVLLSNEIIELKEGKYILKNSSLEYDFVYVENQYYDLYSKIYDADIYKQYLKITTGEEFEQYLSILLRYCGYEAQTTQKSNDYGADIIASKDNIKYAIQCKYYSSPIGISAIQEVLGGIKFYDCNIGIVATNTTFTKQAIELAKKSNIILWDGDYIVEKLIYTH